MHIKTRQGTDTKFPSVVVIIDGQPELPEERRTENLQDSGVMSTLPPLEKTKLTQREIALVFKNGETEAEQLDLIPRAVYRYLNPEPLTVVTGEIEIPDTAPVEVV